MTNQPPPDVRLVLGHIPGRICVDPLDVTTDYPHGGTDLGEVGLCVVNLEMPVTVTRDEADGLQPVEVVSRGESMALFFTLRDYNPSGYEILFPDVSVAGSGNPEILGGSPGGVLYRDRARPVLFSPRDLDHDPMVSIPLGAPHVEATQDLNLMLGAAGDVWEVGAVIVALRYTPLSIPYKIAVRSDMAP